MNVHTPSGQYALEIDQLSKVYANGQVALKKIDLRVEHGDFFALLGPNGAGKSTAIGIITSLVRKTEGQVKVHGFDIDTQAPQAKACIGLVPQEFSFNSFEPAFEILVNQAGYYGVSAKQAREHAEWHLRHLGLWDKRDEETRQLSGGMKRRLMIARAMVHRPHLLILDEPTAGVDIEIRRMIWNYLVELNRQGTTVILTTHYLEEAEQLCRNIAIISDGEIVADTAMRELLSHLDSESFTLYLRHPMNEAPQMENAKFNLIDPQTLEVVVSRTEDFIDVLIQLRALRIEFTGMRNTSNRLEELFLTMIHEQ